MSTNPVRSLLQDDEGFVWLGIRSFGLVRHDLNTDKCIHYTDLPEFRSVLVMPTGNAMRQRRNGEIWFATYNGGIYIYDKKAPVGKQVKVILPEEEPWLLNCCGYRLLEDSAGNIWIGSRDGINVLTPAGEKYSFEEFKTTDVIYNHLAIMDILEDVVHCMEEDKEGKLWLGTDAGLLRLQVGDHYSC